MTGITGITPIGSTAAAGAGASAGDARQVAAEVVDAIGTRVSAWVSALAPGGGATGQSSGFRPDAGVLARGGDVYGLRAMAGEIGARFGATPRQEGDFTRALENFTRAAMIETAGLHGGPTAPQAAGLDSARAAADQADAGSGIDGITTRLEAATDAFAARAR